MLAFHSDNQRKSGTMPNPQRVIPVAPISIQLSHTYKERFTSSFHETFFDEMYGFLEHLHTAGKHYGLYTTFLEVIRGKNVKVKKKNELLLWW